MSGGLKVGDRIQIPKEQHGLPVRYFDRKTKTYTDDLQWFEVTAIEEGKISLKPVWLEDEK